jgi:DNA-binding MarR family transcriptional regulator
VQAITAKAKKAAPRTPDPDAQLVRHLYGFVRYMLHAHGDDYMKAVGELELSLTQIRILRILVDDVEQASLKDIGDRVGLSLPAVSRSIDGLVHRGLVTRAEDEIDRRMKQVRATPQAAEVLDRLTELRLAGIGEFVETLSPRERERLAAAMVPLAERDEIASRCGAPRKLSPAPRKKVA